MRCVIARGLSGPSWGGKIDCFVRDICDKPGELLSASQMHNALKGCLNCSGVDRKNKAFGLGGSGKKKTGDYAQ